MVQSKAGWLCPECGHLATHSETDKIEAQAKMPAILGHGVIHPKPDAPAETKPKDENKPTVEEKPEAEEKAEAQNIPDAENEKTEPDVKPDETKPKDSGDEPSDDDEEPGTHTPHVVGDVPKEVLEAVAAAGPDKPTEPIVVDIAPEETPEKVLAESIAEIEHATEPEKTDEASTDDKPADTVDGRDDTATKDEDEASDDDAPDGDDPDDAPTDDAEEKLEPQTALSSSPAVAASATQLPEVRGDVPVKDDEKPEAADPPSAPPDAPVPPTPEVEASEVPAAPDVTPPEPTDSTVPEPSLAPTPAVPAPPPPIEPPAPSPSPAPAPQPVPPAPSLAPAPVIPDVKPPLQAATHPPALTKTRLIAIVASVVVLLALGGTAVYATIANQKPAQVQSPVPTTTTKPVLGAEITPESSATPSAAAADPAIANAQRQTALATYASAYKALSKNGFYPVTPPVVSVNAYEPSTNQPYAVSKDALVAVGQIRYWPGGSCTGPAITPGSAGTRYLALQMLLEGSNIPYCIDVK